MISSYFTFLKAHDYSSPSVPANVVYVTGQGNNIWCFLGIWGYWRTNLYRLHTSSQITWELLLKPEILEPEGLVQISCPAEFISSSNTVRLYILNLINLSCRYVTITGLIINHDKIAHG